MPAKAMIVRGATLICLSIENSDPVKADLLIQNGLIETVGGVPAVPFAEE